MTLSEVRRSGRRWQRLLRIEDWDVEWRLLDVAAMPDAWGMCYRNSSRQEALITIRKDVPREELETVIVHELIHISVDSFWPTGKRDRERAEQAVHRISQALAQLGAPVGR